MKGNFPFPEDSIPARMSLLELIPGQAWLSSDDSEILLAKPLDEPSRSAPVTVLTYATTQLPTPSIQDW
jgi:hypothetical protein